MQLPTFDRPPDDPAPLEPVTKCDPVERAGVVAFRDWVISELGGDDLGIVRACAAGAATSRHHEGRAWDWAPPSKSAADQLFDCLLKERDGVSAEIARRAGIRTIIWQRRIWNASNRAWRPYTKPGGDPHTTHVHFGFSWLGAGARTSLYTLSSSGDATVLGVVDMASVIYVDDNELAAVDGTEVPARRTPLTEQRLAEVLAAGHVRAFGSPPSYSRLGMAWAQVSHETARTQSAYNHNWGNLIKSGSWKGDFHQLGQGMFRAYPSELAGAADYWRLLQRRYPKALEAFDAGDPQLAAAELKAGGYFASQSAEVYGKALMSLYAEYRRKFADQGWAERLAPLVAAVSLAAAAAYYAQE
jgi:hypothetical protein